MMDAALSRSAIEAQIADYSATSLRHAEMTLRARLGLSIYSDEAIRTLWEILEGNYRFSQRLAAENRVRAQSEIRGR